MNILSRFAAAAILAVAFPGAALLAAQIEPAIAGSPRVVLFERPNFRGESIELTPGEDIPNLANVTFPNGQRANDAVSSIFIEPGAAVTVNDAARFRGQSLRLTASVENLGEIAAVGGVTWNDSISSVRVEAAPGPGWPGVAHDDREPRVVLFREANFRGNSLEVFPGENFDNLNDVSFEGGRNANDAISSIRVVGPVRLRAYAAAGYGQDALEVTQDLANLADLPRSVDGSASWNDCISSLRVERTAGGRNDGRSDRGGASRPGPRVEEPEAVIGRLFKELLFRAPTDDEMRSYRRRIIDDAWTTDMLRADIKRTQEYRQRDADVIINRAFEDLLGRKPDAEGLRNYRELIIERNWTERQVRDALKKSDEYREHRRAQADAIVTRAYRELLGRDPDPGGLESYRNAILDRGLSEKQVRDSIKGSAEYRARQARPPAPQPAPPAQEAPAESSSP